MIKQFLCTINPTIDKFLSELLKKDCNESILDKLLKAGIDIDYQNQEGDTCLHLCIKRNKIASVKWLIDNNCILNIKNKNNMSPIKLAVSLGSIKIVKLLLDTGDINIDEVDTDGRTLLHDAVLNGEIEIVNELIKNSANVNILDNHNRNILFDAVSYGEDKLISKILLTGELNINAVDNEGHTILHKQEILSNDDLAKKFLEYGADPTITDEDGKSFLFHTALRGDEGAELLDFAIEKGCNLNGKIRNNNSILMEIMFAFTNLSEAEKHRRSELIDMATKLVQNGIDINAINNQGETVLFDAVRKNDTEAVAFLLKDGIDVNKRNKRFETALSIAVLKGIEALDIILLLMDYDASITIKIKDLKTILEVLNDIILHTHGNHSMENQNLLAQIDIDNGRYLIVLRDILSKTKIKLDYNDFAGNPIYFKSLLYGNIDLFKLYVKYGIDINKINSKDKTLFHEYVLRIFDIGIYNPNFEQVLLLLVNNKADVNKPLPEDGKTVTSYVVSKRCNVELFKTLINKTRCNFKLQDNLGRTIMHSCITGNNLEILKLLYTQDDSIMNIPDYYNILPLTYCALMGNYEMLLEMIKLDSHITCDKKITSQARVKFAKLLPNLDKLIIKVYDPDDLRKINIVIDQIKKEFLI